MNIGVLRQHVGEDLDGPDLKPDGALGEELPSGLLVDGILAVDDMAPAHRAEEADRLVFRAVPLPVACDDLESTTAGGVIAVVVHGSPVDRVAERGAVLPGNGLSKAWIASNLAEPLGPVAGPEHLQAAHGEAARAHPHVAPECPPARLDETEVVGRAFTGRRGCGVGHVRGPRS